MAWSRRSTVRDGNVRTWEDAQEYMTYGRSPDDRPLANNTRLHRLIPWNVMKPSRDRNRFWATCTRASSNCPEGAEEGDECFGVLLHRTYVVVYHWDGRIEVNTGGWDTPTTWDRISRFTPIEFRFWSEREYVPIAVRDKRVRDWFMARVRRRMENDRDLTEAEAVRIEARELSETRQVRRLRERREGMEVEPRDFEDGMYFYRYVPPEPSRRDGLDVEREHTPCLGRGVRVA